MTRDEYNNSIVSQSLKHHGILGQKWGRKAGPPYPLDPSDRTSAEKKANASASTKSISKNNETKNCDKNTRLFSKEFSQFEDDLTDDCKKWILKEYGTSVTKKMDDFELMELMCMEYSDNTGNDPYKNTELKHHGILGQKWGHKAGPPYPLSPSSHTAAEKKAGYQKSIKSMSDDELNSAIKRLENEKKYMDLVSPKTKKDGEKTVSDILKGAGKTALGIVTTSVLTQAGKIAVKKLAPEFEKDMEWKKLNK